jgi:hypothetical protein
MTLRRAQPGAQKALSVCIRERKRVNSACNNVCSCLALANAILFLLFIFRGFVIDISSTAPTITFAGKCTAMFTCVLSNVMVLAVVPGAIVQYQRCD